MDIRNGSAPGKKEKPHPIHVVSVTSGKGGVGKTNVVINVGIALSRMGYKVMIFDADLGLANVDVLLGLTPRFNIRHVLSGRQSLSDVIVDGPEGIKILPAASGVDEIAHLTDQERILLLSHFESYEEDFDILLIDTGAGIGPNVMYFNSAARQILVVATAEPTSITDAYAVMKVLSTKYGEKEFTLLVNNVKNDQAAKAVYQNLSSVAERFLNISIDYAGFIPSDSNLTKAVTRQKALVQLYPQSPSSEAFSSLAGLLVKRLNDDRLKGSLQFCWRRLLVKE
jgi:flagellar biosynthesis protein FlhG